jgi:exosortase
LTVATLSTTSSERSGFRGLELAAAALVALAVGLAYAPTFAFLNQIWYDDPNYSYGYFVIPIALAILWLRQDSLDRARLAPKWWGWALLMGVVGLRAYFYQINQQWLEDATIPLALASLALAFGGWHLLRWSLPAIVFLGFMYPLPNRVNTVLAFRLQSFATTGSCSVLQAMGLPVVAEGNVIHIGAEKLEVARACNGLSMLLSFITLITAAAILIQRPIWDRVILLATAIPIALVANIVRITITGLCFSFFGTDEILVPILGKRLPHDWAGYLMMPMALVLIWLELKVLSWVVVDEEEQRPEALSTFGQVPAGAFQAAKKESKPEENKAKAGGGQ